MDEQTQLEDYLIEFFHLLDSEDDTLWENDRRIFIDNIF